MNNIEVTKVHKRHFSGEKHLYRYNMHTNEGMLIFIACGSGKAILNGKQFTYSRNSVILCTGGDSLCFKCSKSIDADLYAVEFKLKDADVFKTQYNMQSEIFKLYNCTSFCDCFERLYLAHIHKEQLQKKNDCAIFYELIFLALDSKKEKGIVDAVVSKLAEDIHKDFIRGEIDVSVYAEEAGLSKDRLSVIFKERYSLPPYKYQLMLKIDEATRLLRHTNLPIGKISEMLGFSSQLYFSSAYKKQTGKTPSEIRKIK